MKNFLKDDDTVNLPRNDDFDLDEHTNLVEEFKYQYDNNKFAPFSKGLGISFSYEDFNSFIFSPYRMNIKIMTQIFAYLGYLKMAENFDDSWGFLVGFFIIYNCKKAQTVDIKKNQFELMKNLRIEEQNDQICFPIQLKSQIQQKFAIIIKFDIKYVPIILFPTHKKGYVVDYNSSEVTHATKMGIFAMDVLKNRFQLFQNIDTEYMEWNTETQKLDKQVSDLSVSSYMFLHIVLIHQNINDPKSFKFQSFLLSAEQRGYFKKVIEWLLFKLKDFEKPNVEVLRPRKAESVASTPQESQSEQESKITNKKSQSVKQADKLKTEQSKIKKAPSIQQIKPMVPNEKSEKEQQYFRKLQKQGNKDLSLISSIYSLPYGQSKYQGSEVPNDHRDSSKIYIKRPRHRYVYDDDRIESIQVKYKINIIMQQRYENFHDFRSPYAKNMLEKLRQIDQFFDKEPEEIQQLSDQNPEIKHYIKNLQIKLAQSLPQDEQNRVIRQQSEEINKLSILYENLIFKGGNKLKQQKYYNSMVLMIPKALVKTIKYKNFKIFCQSQNQSNSVNKQLQILSASFISEKSPQIQNKLLQMKNEIIDQIKQEVAISHLKEKTRNHSLPLLALNQSDENIVFRNKFIQNSPNVINYNISSQQMNLKNNNTASIPKLPSIQPDNNSAQFYGVKKEIKFNQQSFAQQNAIMCYGQQKSELINKNGLVAYRYNFPIYQEQLQDMQNMVYLPSNILNFILGYTLEKHYNLVKFQALEQKKLRFYMFPTTFYSDLTNNDLFSNKIYYKRCLNYTMNFGQKNSLFKYDQIIFPIFFDTIGEYALCVSDNEEKTIDFLELGLNDEISRSQIVVLKNLQSFLQYEYSSQSSNKEIINYKLYKGKCQRVDKSNLTAFYLIIYVKRIMQGSKNLMYEMNEDQVKILIKSIDKIIRYMGITTNQPNEINFTKYLEETI